MLTNYIKMAWKVLGRRKFFTFISLFGISFTLMILMLITAFLNQELGKKAPMKNRDRLVMMPFISQKLVVPDTSYQIDSTYLDGRMVYDSTMDIGEQQRSMSIGGIGYYFLDNYMRAIPSAQNYTFFNIINNFDVYLEHGKLEVSPNFCDANYWEVFNFPFLDGKPFTRVEVENAAQVAVLTDKAAIGYFGTTEDVLGKRISLDGKQFEVIGLVPKYEGSRDFLTSDLFLPLSTSNPAQLNDEDFLGGFSAAFLAESPSRKARLLADIEHLEQTIQMPDPKQYNQLVLNPMTFFQFAAWNQVWEEDPKKSFYIVSSVLMGLLLLFILLPSLNLININISRIMERNSEIGIRKAFGADSRAILLQFIFENIILTFLGGAIGLIMAWLLLNALNESQLLGAFKLKFDWRVFIYSIIIFLLFGLLSGILPAWRMSRVQIADALKSNPV